MKLKPIGLENHIKNGMSLTNIKYHLYALLLLLVCATGYLFDVLFFDKHLSGFDIVLEKPSWRVEFGDIKAHNKMLSDSPTAHYPYKKEFWEAAKRGYNSQYLPHIFSGKPTSGQGVGIFSTSLFQFFMDTPDALDFSTWFRLLLASLLMYFFLFQLGLGSAPATLGAIAWTYNMHQIAWLMFPQHLATQLWLPLLFGLNLLVLKNPTKIASILGLILCVVFFFSSGYTQIVLYSFIFLGVFNTLYIIFALQQSAPGKLKTWLWIHGVYLLAGLFMLPDALWQAQDIADGLRGTQNFRYSSFKFDFSVTALIQLVKDCLPNSIDAIRYLTPNYKSELGQIPAITSILKSNVVEFLAYFGLLCLYLSLYGIVKSFVEKNRLLIVLVILLILSIALFNRNATIISLMEMIPFAGAGSYSRIISLIILLAIIVAAFGAKSLLVDLDKKKYQYLFITSSLIVLWLFSAKETHPDIVSVREFIPWMIYLAGFILLSVFLVRFKQAKLVLPIAILLTLGELVITGYNFNTRLDSKDHFPPNSIIKQIRSTEGDFRTALLLDHTGYQHNILSYYDLSTIGGYETTAPNDYLYFMRKAYQKVHITLNGILFLFDGNLEILRLLNTRFIISNLNLNSDLISPVYSNKAETLYEFNDPLNRVFCASDQLVNPNTPAIPNQLADISKKLDRPLILTEPVIDAQKLTKNCTIHQLKVFSSKLEFTVDSDLPTLIFIPVNYHKYWSARVNGADTEIHQANFSFMALKVDQGSSEVVLEFINTKLTIEAVLLLLLGIVTILTAVFKVNSNWQKIIFIACGILLTGKSMLSIPGIMNTNIPEKPVIHDSNKMH